MRVIPISQPVVVRALKVPEPSSKRQCLFSLRHCVLLHFLHGPLLKLVALSNLLGVHGLFRSLVVAFLAVAVRSNSGLRTAIIRMLVFHRSTSALPVHWWPLRDAHFTPACSSKTTYFRPEDEPLRWARRAERECGFVRR